MLSLRTVYRVEERKLKIELNEECEGQIRATLLAYNGPFPTNVVWSSPVRDYKNACNFTFDITDGTVALAGEEWGRVLMPLPTRRFCWRIMVEGTDGRKRERLTGHYLVGNSQRVDADYYQGGNYFDHEAQSMGEHREVIQLLRSFCGQSPVLEVGCATGGLLSALDASGFESVGVDISEWAVESANKRLGTTRAWVCDVENDSLPSGIVERGPFKSLILWAVFEHFRDPYRVLAKLSQLAAPGATLLVNTTNADSLTHILFGKQWEGYFDYTHHGVDQVSVNDLREKLPRLGWQIKYLTTHLVWDCSPDPLHATLREWYGADARFRRLLAERDLADLVTCVAVKA